jgi:hypothetical protein
MAQIAAISESFMQRGATAGAGPQQGMGEGDTPVALPQQPGGATGGGVSSAQVYSAGGAHVNEEVRRLAKLTGVYDNPGAAPYPQK